MFAVFQNGKVEKEENEKALSFSHKYQWFGQGLMYVFSLFMLSCFHTRHSLLIQNLIF